MVLLLFPGVSLGSELIGSEEELLALVPEEKRPALLQALALDPRPAYQDDPSRRYGFGFAGMDIRFTVNGSVLTVTEIAESSPSDGPH